MASPVSVATNILNQNNHVYTEVTRRSMSNNTQQIQSSVKRDRLWKLKMFFKIPRFYVSLLESKDKQKAIFMRGFNKHKGSFMVDRFDLEEKEKVEAHFTESVGAGELLESFLRSIWSRK